MRILIVSEVPWLAQPSRKHLLVRRFPGDWDVLFISPANARGGENSFRVRTDTSYRNVRYGTLFLPKPDSGIAAVRALTRPLTMHGARAIRSILGTFRPDVVVTSFIWAAPAVPAMRRAGVPVVYDLNDLHYDFYPRHRAQAERFFRLLVDSADEVVCSSRRLRDIAGRGVVIGNGVDLDTFRGRRPGPLPGLIAESPIGDAADFAAYVGSIDERVDFELLAATARALSERSPRTALFCLGRVFDAVRERAAGLAREFPRHVVIAGPVAYDELPAYLSRASVGIAPFVLSERTKAVNPNKLYIYAAMEMNVVSTPFSDEIEERRDAIYVASGRDAFAAAVIGALGDEERRRNVRARIALPNSWDEKARDFADLLVSMVERSR